MLISGAAYETSIRIRPILQMRKLRSEGVRGWVERSVIGGAGLNVAIRSGALPLG